MSKYIFTSRFIMFYFSYFGGEVGLMGGVVAGGEPVWVSVVEWYGLLLESARLAACKCSDFPLKIGRRL